MGSSSGRPLLLALVLLLALLGVACSSSLMAGAGTGWYWLKRGRAGGDKGPAGPATAPATAGGGVEAADGDRPAGPGVQVDDDTAQALTGNPDAKGADILQNSLDSATYTARQVARSKRVPVPDAAERLFDPSSVPADARTADGYSLVYDPASVPVDGRSCIEVYDHNGVRGRIVVAMVDETGAGGGRASSDTSATALLALGRQVEEALARISGGQMSVGVVAAPAPVMQVACPVEPRTPARIARDLEQERAKPATYPPGYFEKLYVYKCGGCNGTAQATWAAALKAQDAAGAAGAGAYNSRCIVVPSTARCGWAGIGDTNAPSNGRFFLKERSARVMLHEYFHNLGLRHAGSAGSEYGDKSCVMGSSAQLALSSAATFTMGWLAGERPQAARFLNINRFLAGSAEQTFTLDSTGGAGGVHTVVLFREVVPFRVDAAARQIYFAQSCVFPLYFISYRGAQDEGQVVLVHSRAARSPYNDIPTYSGTFLHSARMFAGKNPTRLDSGAIFGGAGKPDWAFFYGFSGGGPPSGLAPAVAAAMRLADTPNGRLLVASPTAKQVNVRVLSVAGGVATVGVSAVPG